MQEIDLTKTGGFPFTQNALGFLQTAYKELFAAVGGSFGDKAIVAGMEVGGSSVADGWFFYNGEFIKFNACSLDNKVSITQTLTSVEFEDGLTKAVYYVKTAVCAATGDFDFSDLVRIAPFTAALKAKYDVTFLTGDIKEVDCTNAYIATNFDSTGLGRLERLGWAICNGQNGTKQRGGRVSVGYDANTIDPHDNVWDVAYNTMGETGGENKHTLSVAEVPALTVDIPKVGYAGIGGTGLKFVGDASTPDSGEAHINTNGGGQSHENRQPFIVTLFIQKL